MMDFLRPVHLDPSSAWPEGKSHSLQFFETSTLMIGKRMYVTHWHVGRLPATEMYQGLQRSMLPHLRGPRVAKIMKPYVTQSCSLDVEPLIYVRKFFNHMAYRTNIIFFVSINSDDCRRKK